MREQEETQGNAAKTLRGVPIGRSSARTMDCGVMDCEKEHDERGGILPQLQDLEKLLAYQLEVIETVTMRLAPILRGQDGDKAGNGKNIWRSPLSECLGALEIKVQVSLRLLHDLESRIDL
jgi:hypothetical protein